MNPSNPSVATTKQHKEIAQPRRFFLGPRNGFGIHHHLDPLICLNDLGIREKPPFRQLGISSWG